MEDLSFFLEGVVKDRDQQQDFEGPLSLILLLLSKNKIEIRDISISDILDQYLEYLDKMQSMDLEIASEFVQMAAHLLYIKTKTLLTAEEEVSELQELMDSLEKLKCRDTFAAVQKIVPELKKASELGLLYYPKPPEPLPQTGREYEYKHAPVELLLALKNVFSRGVKTPEDEAGELAAAVPKRIIYSVRSKSREIITCLKAGGWQLNALYAQCKTTTEIVATFISVLELCSMGSVRLDRQGDGWFVSFIGGDEDEIIEKIVE